MTELTSAFSVHRSADTQKRVHHVGEAAVCLGDAMGFYAEWSRQPADDGGNNFGRVARTKIMSDYINELMDERLLGIPLADWQKFLKRF